MSEYELSGGAFVLHESGEPVRVHRESFSSEDEFQELIAKYPELLAGEMVSPDNPRKWLLITREAGIADSESGIDRWAVDHLFVDQDGTPTFVEVKRRSDSRLKRDVVGQILGYVAFATAFLSGERLRELFEDRVAEDGSDPVEAVDAFLGDSGNVEGFWNEVELKMQAGEVRALVVADSIPMELQRILEFLNNRMSGLEVLGLELQLYAMGAYRTLVPRVVGRTAHSEDRKRSPAARHWSLDELRERVSQTSRPEALAALDKILSWGEQEMSVWIESGTGSKYPSARFRIMIDASPCTLFAVALDQATGFNISIYLGAIINAQDDLLSLRFREELLQDIASNIDPAIDTANTEKYPSFRLKLDESASRTIEVLERLVREITR